MCSVAATVWLLFGSVYYRLSQFLGSTVLELHSITGVCDSFINLRQFIIKFGVNCDCRR